MAISLEDIRSMDMFEVSENHHIASKLNASLDKTNNERVPRL